MPRLLVEQRGPVTLLTLNRPEVHNCVDAETAVVLAQAIERFAANEAARVLIITGAGETAFCSGADLKDVEALAKHPYVERASPMGFAKLDPGKPTIAAITGYCFAGGMELACWCDFRIAEEHSEFGALNRRWGVPFFDGGTQRFARIVGQGNALWMIETGVRFGVQHALRMGLVQEVVPTGRAVARAIELAETIVTYPQQSIQTDRQATLATFGMPLGEGLRYEAQIGLRSAQAPEMKAGLQRFIRRDRPAPPRL
jgi:enoyl-CoA hydratase